MSEQNEKSMDALKSLVSALKTIEGMSGKSVSDLDVKYKTTDLGVNINETAEKAYTKKLAITGDATGIPADILKKITQNKENLILEKITHIINQSLEK